MGGGGFTMEPGNPALDDFVLTLAGRGDPRILFLPTASGDPGAQIAGFRAAFGARACRPAHLSLFRLEHEPVDLRTTILAQDIVYVGGGSMRNLLAIWREHGLDAILREAWERGVVLAGLSAGAMCWFAEGISRSGGVPARVPGLGLLPGSLSVHYDGDPARRPAYLAAVARGAISPGWGADDGLGLLFDDRRLARVVASRPYARAYRVTAVGGRAVEREVKPELLPGATPGGGRSEAADVREFRDQRHAAGRRWSAGG
jgi:peptidase E